MTGLLYQRKMAGQPLSADKVMFRLPLHVFLCLEVLESAVRIE